MTKIVQVGCGYWGKNLVRNFAKLEVLGGVVDGESEVTARMQEIYGVPATSFEAALANPEIDGIALATPAETHAVLATKALEAGKHVYVEKPLALKPADAEALIDLAGNLDRRLMVGHLLQYHPIFIALRGHVDAGLIGDVEYVYSNRMSFGKFRTEENVLWSFAPHDFSMLLSLVGQAPTSVTAQGASIVTPDVADWCTAQFEFENGVRGHIQVSWLHPFKEQRLVVVGSKGMLVFEDSVADWDKKLAHYPHAINTEGPVPVAEKADAIYLEVPKGEPLWNECQHFVDCIRSGANPRTDGNEGLLVLRALSAAERALAASLAGDRVQ